MNEWTRRGRLLVPTPTGSWWASHAALPIVDPRATGLELYFSGRDRAGRGHIGRAIVALEPPGVVSIEPDPVLAPGRLGTFDDSGVTGSCLAHHDGGTYLYYTGWMLGVTVPFYLQVGLAVSSDGRRFERASEAPLLDRSPVDPLLTASPWVLRDGGIWRMWYVSATDWEQGSDAPRHRYHIRYAESDDAVLWRRAGRICLDYGSPDEHAFGRPCVIKDGRLYRMWYCYRGDAYRLGYAESDDGLVWRRLDREAGLDPAPSGWDSEMIAYPVVFDRAGRRHLLYNGNGYGETGIGLASAAAGADAT